MRINAVKWVSNMRSQKLSMWSQFFSENILSGIFGIYTKFGIINHLNILNFQKKVRLCPALLLAEKG